MGTCLLSPPREQTGEATPPFACPLLLQVQVMKASSNKRTCGKKRPGDFCVESKSNIFVLVVHNGAANLLFAKILGLENQGEPHSLPPDDVRKQRAAEMRFFFCWENVCASQVLLCSTRDVSCPVHGQGRRAEAARGDAV